MQDHTELHKTKKGRIKPYKNINDSLIPNRIRHDKTSPGQTIQIRTKQNYIVLHKTIQDRIMHGHSEPDMTNDHIGT